MINNREKCPKCRLFVAHDGAFGLGCSEEDCHYSTRPSRYQELINIDTPLCHYPQYLVAEEQPNNPPCRGSWLLGSACGSCSRCAEEAPQAIATLRGQVARMQGQLKLLISCIPPVLPTMQTPGGAAAYDFTDAVKIKLFEAARAQLYCEDGSLR